MKLKQKDFRLNNLYKITNKDGGVITFKERPAQAHYRENAHTRNIILKARQIGFTTMKCIDGIDNSIFNLDKTYTGLIIAHNDDFAKKIFTDKIRFAWDNFDPDLKKYVQKISDTDRSLKLGLSTERSHINSLSVAVSARAGTYNDIHITELSTVDQNEPMKAREIISGAMPALSYDGTLTIESTAKQNHGFFHDIFMEAWKMRNHKLTSKDFKAHFYNWQWDEYELGKITAETINIIIPQLTPYFKDYQRQYSLTDKEIACYFLFWKSCNKDFDILQQEYPTTVEEAFTAGSDLYFSTKTLNEYPTITGRQNGDWKYLKDPKPDHVYVMGADVAEGIERDYSAAVIIDVTAMFEDSDLEVVATYKNNTISPTNFAYELAQAGKYYNTAYIAPERNNHGHATIGKLLEIYDKRKIHVERKIKMGHEESAERYGWLTSGATKPMMISQLNDAINLFHININDEDLISELKTFPKGEVNRQKPKVGVTTHWDLVIALAIAYQMRRFAVREENTFTPPRPDILDPTRR